MDIQILSDLGQMFYFGLSSKRRNYRKAFPYLLKAAKAGHAHSQNLVGISFNQALGVERNTKKAKYWYDLAAKKSNNIA